jgi:hypothetical protein
MTRGQKVLAALCLLWGFASIIGGTRQIWDALSHNTARNATIAVAFVAATFATIWMIYKVFFAQYIDPIIRDSIASFQKNMGVTKG